MIWRVGVWPCSIFSDNEHMLPNQDEGGDKVTMLCFWIDLGCLTVFFFIFSFQWIYFLVFFLMVLSRSIAIRSRCNWHKYNTIKEIASSLFCICFLLKTHSNVLNYSCALYRSVNVGFIGTRDPRANWDPSRFVYKFKTT